LFIDLTLGGLLSERLNVRLFYYKGIARGLIREYYRSCGSPKLEQFPYLMIIIDYYKINQKQNRASRGKRGKTRESRRSEDTIDIGMIGRETNMSALIG